MIKNIINNFCKVMLAGCVLGMAAFAPNKVEAATISTNFTQIATNLLLTVPVTVSSVTISASSSNAFTANLYDTAYTTNTIAVGAYTNRITYVTNMVSTYVTTTGVTNYLTNQVLYTASNPVAANANTPLPAAGTFTVSAGQATTFPVELIFSRGVLVKGNTNGTITINYQASPASP